jgi:hypothetical protein
MPLADVLGVGDDIERSVMVERASADELRDMVAAVDAHPSREYIALTCLTKAAD